LHQRGRKANGAERSGVRAESPTRQTRVPERLRDACATDIGSDKAAARIWQWTGSGRDDVGCVSPCDRARAIVVAYEAAENRTVAARYRAACISVGNRAIVVSDESAALGIWARHGDRAT